MTQGGYVFSEKERAELLDRALMTMASQGKRIETRLPTSAVVVTGKPVNNVLHLLLSIFLCGFWVPIWLLLGAFTGERRETVSVDEYGQLHAQKVPLSAGRIVLIVLAAIVMVIWFLTVGSGLVALVSPSSSTSSMALLLT